MDAILSLIIYFILFQIKQASGMVGKSAETEGAENYVYDPYLAIDVSFNLF